MRRTIVAIILSVSILASCSPYDSPAGASPAAQPARSSTDPCVPGDKPCWEAHIELQRIWMAEVKAQAERARIARIYAFAYAVERARLQRLAANPPYRSGQCGGSLPPCWVMRRESGGDIRIWNGGCYAPVGWRGKSPCGVSSASGKWQAIRSSWAGFGGYVNAADAPEAVQDAWARRLYAGGRGGRHWGL